MTDVRVAAVMAAYNRRDLTLACLASLEAQRVPGVKLDSFIADDASTDGTAEAIAERFPDTVVLHGSGQLYWNGGMRLAFGTAIERDYDHYLWMNDDTALDDGALKLLLDTQRELEARGEDAPIVVGSTRHPDTGELTYGGLVRRSRVRPLKWELVQPTDEPQPVETLNGNTVLFPREAVRRVGNIDSGYIQQMGDYDYGLQARAAGCAVWIAPGTIGTCASHPLRDTTAQPLRAEMARIWSTKQLAPRQWARFSRRYAGPLWPIYFVSPYIQRSVRLMLERVPFRRLRADGP